MLTDDYDEVEIQALITLAELSYPVDNPNNNHYKPFPKTISEAKTYFRRFGLDFSQKYEQLLNKGLIYGEINAWHLTSKGKKIADEMRLLRPPIYYFYKDYYTAIGQSKAFDTYATKVFGRNLGQHGFSDLKQVHKVLELVRLDKSSRVLDIGCGTGGIAEYIADATQASITGVDYVPEAIMQALTRTKDKRNRLDFRLNNLEDMDFKEESFDLILSIDSVYFSDTKATLSNWIRLLKTGGKMAIFYLDMSGKDIVTYLKEGNFSYKTYDLSRENYEHMQLKHKIASALKKEFEEEGNDFIWKNLITESIADTDPYDPTRVSIIRHLYVVSKKNYYSG